MPSRESLSTARSWRTDGAEREIRTFRDYLPKLVKTGGPSEPDYPVLNRRLQAMYRLCRAGDIGAEDLATLREALGETLCLDTIHGFGLLKPRGYAGDFEIVEAGNGRGAGPRWCAGSGRVARALVDSAWKTKSPTLPLTPGDAGWPHPDAGRGARLASSRRRRMQPASPLRLFPWIFKR
jgi:hypothetical protein